MNYETLRETVVARRNAFLFLLMLAILNLGLQLYLSLWQRPALARAQNDWFARREALSAGRGGGAARYQATERDLAEFGKLLIPKREFASFMGEVFDAARKNSLNMKGIGYKPTVLGQKGMISYAISYTVSGKYASVKKFIADLAAMPRMVTLDSVSLTSSSRTEESVNLQVKMTAYLKTEGA